ncbi:uncharacterized protein LOC144438171 [Glandiceps talaboti]
MSYLRQKNIFLGIVICFAAGVGTAAINRGPRNTLLPSITSHPDSTVIDKGSKVTLDCSLHSSASGTVDDLTWYFNGRRLSSERFHTTENGTLELVIQNAEFSDGGSYSCGPISYPAEYRISTALSVGSESFPCN